MSLIFRVPLLLSILSFGICSASESNTVTVRGGKLTVVGESGSGEQKLLLNGKELPYGDGSSLFIEKKYIIGDKDVVLMMSIPGGTACPAQYFFVSISPQGNAKVSPEFGTCSDLPEFSQKGLKITAVMSKMTGRNVVKYIYENETIFENGKAIKDTSSQPEDEGEVIINGRGQILVSGDPNKKILRCVQNLVEKERRYSDGWDERIIAECDKLKKR